MRVKAVMLGLVLGAAGWAATGAVNAAPMAPAKAFLAINSDVEVVAKRSAKAHKARPARTVARKASRAVMAHRAHKSAEPSRIARKGHLERHARHQGPKTAEVHKREHRADIRKGERHTRIDKHPVDPNRHYRREVGDWSRQHAHKDWKDHMRRHHKDGKDRKDRNDVDDGKKTKVTYLGSIDHDKSNDNGDDDYDNDNGYDRKKKHDRYYSGRGVSVDNDNGDQDEEDKSENGDKEEKTAQENGYRNCEKGRDCDVKMKWIRVPVKEEEEVPLK